jgi:hypothetical protein
MGECEEKKQYAQDQYDKNGKKREPAAHELRGANPGDFDFGPKHEGKLRRGWEPSPMGKGSPTDERRRV